MLQLAILALLVLLNGAFALAELALVSSRRAMLTLMERQGLRGDKQIIATNRPLAVRGARWVGLIEPLVGAADQRVDVGRVGENG